MLAVLLSGPPGLARAQAVAPWFTQVMAQLATIPERHETFREEKRLAALNRPLVSEGQLVYRRPAYLEKVTVAPRPEVLLVEGDQLTLTGADGSPRTVFLGSRPEIGVLVDAIGGMLAGDLGRIERSYTIHVAGDARAWQLVLIPTNERVQEMLRQIVIRGSETVIQSVWTEQANGDSQTMTIDSPAKPPFAGTLTQGERQPGVTPPRPPDSRAGQAP